MTTRRRTWHTPEQIVRKASSVPANEALLQLPRYNLERNLFGDLRHDWKNQLGAIAVTATTMRLKTPP